MRFRLFSDTKQKKMACRVPPELLTFNRRGRGVGWGKMNDESDELVIPINFEVNPSISSRSSQFLYDGSQVSFVSALEIPLQVKIDSYDLK